MEAAKECYGVPHILRREVLVGMCPIVKRCYKDFFTRMHSEFAAKAVFARSLSSALSCLVRYASALFSASKRS